MLLETRVCKVCNNEKHVEQFQLIKNKKYARRRVCYSCRWVSEKDKKEIYQASVIRKCKRKQVGRLLPEKRAYYLAEDMARADRQKGRKEHSISEEWIDNQISQPCSYCKQQLSKTDMTLDRVDNNLGHLEENLVPACKACNYFRRDMPYEAWLILAENMPKIVETGLLNGWSAGAGLRGKRTHL